MSGDKDNKEKIIAGTCVWPLFPFQVVRSDLVEFGAAGTSLDIGYCPFRYQQRSEKNNECKMCTFDNDLAPNNPCKQYLKNRYINYHKNFLLLEAGEEADHNFFQVIDNCNNFIEAYNNVQNNEQKKEFIRCLDLFPQPIELPNLLFKEYFEKEGNGDSEKLFVKIIEKKEYDKDNDNIFINRNASKVEKFYGSCDFLESSYDYKNTGTASAFKGIIKIDAINNILPSIKDNKKYLFLLVQASFYADKGIDAVIGLVIKAEESCTLVSQALGSVLETLYSQRKSYLDSWCRRLRQLAANKKEKWEKDQDKQKKWKEMKDDTATTAQEKEKQIREEELEKLYESIGWMIKVLAAEKNAKIKENDIFVDKNYNHRLDINGCEKEKFCLILTYSSKDRCKAICEFCNHAKWYLEDGWSQTSKLKGILYSDSVRDLRAIADTDPIKAKLLIRGGGGSGKGAVAKSFHNFCMENIGKAIWNPIHEKKFEHFINEPKNSNYVEYKNLLKKCIYSLKVMRYTKNYKTSSIIIELLDKIPDNNLNLFIKLLDKPAKEFFETIKNNLENIKRLPSLGYKKALLKQKNIWNFTRDQVTGSSWWLWEEKIKEEKLKKISKDDVRELKDLENYIEECIVGLKDKCRAEGFDTIFLKMLIAKIAYEYKKKEQRLEADWNFNFFQVNCGILGGEGAELSESLARLFGSSGSNTQKEKGQDAVPGLFQTCSYVGGTLYLDEIADAPIRIQDNLLRPLEEGEVSRPGWDSFAENVKNIRIITATFKNLEKLADRYDQTLPSGDPQGFRSDLLTRLKSNVPVNAVPPWHYLVPHHKHAPKALRENFCFVLRHFGKDLPESFWGEVYNYISGRLDRVYTRAVGHIPDEIGGRRHYASRINSRFFNALIARTPEGTDKLTPDLRDYLDRMLDFLLTEVGPEDA